MARRIVAILAALSLVMLVVTSAFAEGQSRDSRQGRATPYHQTNLVSDIPGLAKTTDPNLVNAWGMSASSTSPIWVSDNGAGVSTLYNGSGQPFPVGSPLVVTIPPPMGSPAGTTSTPTGTVFNPTAGFVVTSGGKSAASLFLFATEDGTISGWNPTVDPKNAILAVPNTDGGAVYKGLAIGHNSSGDFIYATNFHAGTVDVFDSHFMPAHLAGSFTDRRIPVGYAPFGIQNIDGRLYVTYAKQDAAKHDDDSGPGRGFVDVFDTNGHLIRRLASRGTLNSPWGLALAPAGFGAFSHALLVGNFGDGRISAFDPHTGRFLGQLKNERHQPITIDGLWGLRFGNGGNGGDVHTLFFTAGPDGEQHGLFGTLTKGRP